MSWSFVRVSWAVLQWNELYNEMYYWIESRGCQSQYILCEHSNCKTYNPEVTSVTTKYVGYDVSLVHYCAKLCQKLLNKRALNIFTRSMYLLFIYICCFLFLTICCRAQVYLLFICICCIVCFLLYLVGRRWPVRCAMPVAVAVVLMTCWCVMTAVWPTTTVV